MASGPISGLDAGPDPARHTGHGPVSGWGQGGAQRQAGQQAGGMIVRTYTGRTSAGAADAMRMDLSGLHEAGWAVAAQSWAEGGRTGAAGLFVGLGILFLLGGLLFFPLLGIGIVCLLIGLASGKGPGTLTVTLARQPQGAAAHEHPGGASAMASLEAMRGAGHVTPDEYAAKRAEILARL